MYYFQLKLMTIRIYSKCINQEKHVEQKTEVIAFFFSLSHTHTNKQNRIKGYYLIYKGIIYSDFTII